MITLNRTIAIIFEMDNEGEVLPYLNNAEKLVIQHDMAALTHAALQSGVPVHIKTLDTGKLYHLSYLEQELTVTE